MAKVELDAAGKALCRSLFERLIEPLRAVAWWHGYALGVHGSLERDIDLIAVPWIEDCAPQEVLAEAIRQCALREIGYAWLAAEERDAYFQKGCPGAHPHGRRVWSFHLGGGPYIDLSVVRPQAYESPLLTDHADRVALTPSADGRDWHASLEGDPRTGVGPTRGAAVDALFRRLATHPAVTVQPKEDPCLAPS